MAIQIDKAIFLHVPKTGGSFINNYFKETGMDHDVKEIALNVHISGAALRDIIGFTEDLVFCFVRHPLTWYRSYWIHKQKLVSHRNGKYLDEIVDLPFHEFLSDIIQNSPGYLASFYNSFTERCRFIGKQESLRHDLDQVLKYLRIPYDRPYLYSKALVNVNPTVDQKYSYTLASAIMKSEKEIVKTYNYDYLPLGIIE